MGVEVELPQLSTHLLDLDLDTNLFLPRWLSCLFVTTLPTPAVLRLWDFLLAAEPCPSSKDAGTVLLRLTMALLARAEEELLEASDVEQALEALGSTVESVVAVDVDRMLVREWTEERFVAASAEARGDWNDASQGDVPSEDVAEVEGMEETSTNASTSPCEVDGSSECAMPLAPTVQSATVLGDKNSQLHGCMPANCLSPAMPLA